MIREAINELKKYTLGKKNTEKVEISVLQLNRIIKALEQEPCRDMEEIKEVMSCDADTKCKMISNILTAKPHYFEKQEPKMGHCKDCKHFRKLPHHANALGKCIQHTRFFQKSDWYCADYEPRKECNTCKHQLKFMCSEWKECQNYSKYEPKVR